jgi:hypothetical protein
LGPQLEAATGRVRTVAKKKSARSSSGRRAARKSPKKGGAASRPAAHKKARKTGRKPAVGRARRSAGSGRPRARKPARKAPAKKVTRKAAPGADRETYEGSWKADEEYREGLPESAETHDAEQLAGEVAEELEADFPDSEDEDAAQSARRGAEEEPEW